MTTPSPVDAKITQAEMIELFGEAMPVEAWQLMADAPDGWTLAQVRQRLREIAASPVDVSSLTRRNCGNPITYISSLTRPIIGIENRTAQEVFDIMCDRIRRHNTEADALRELREAAFEFQCAIRANASARTIDAADKRLTAALEQEPKDARP